MPLHVGAHVFVHFSGSVPQSHLPQSKEVALAEEFLDGPRRLVRDVDLTLMQAVDQFIGWKVNQLNFVSLIDDAVRDGFTHDHAGDLLDNISQAFQVLDIDGGIHIDAGIQDFLHIQVAFGMAHGRRIGMGQLIHNHKTRMASQNDIQIHFRKNRAAITNLAAGEHFQALDQGFGFLTPVRLDIADDQIHALLLARSAASNMV